MRMVRLVFLLAALVPACSKSSDPAAPAAAPAPTGSAAPAAAAAPAKAKKDPATARAMIAKGATVVDVRTAEEFADGHLASATNIPVETFADKIEQVASLVGGDKTKPIVVYCAGGFRAGKAKQQLDAAGFTNVVNGGGYDDLR